MDAVTALLEKPIEAPITLLHGRRRLRAASRHKDAKVDLSAAITMRFKNRQTYQSIADKYNCTAQNIEQLLRPYILLFGNPDEIKAYTDNRIPFLNSVEKTLLIDMMDERKRNDASLNNTAYAFKQIFDARRLESGQATERIDYVNVSSRAEARRAQIEKLSAEVGEIVDIEATPIPD